MSVDGRWGLQGEEGLRPRDLPRTCPGCESTMGPAFLGRRGRWSWRAGFFRPVRERVLGSCFDTWESCSSAGPRTRGMAKATRNGTRAKKDQRRSSRPAVRMGRSRWRRLAVASLHVSEEPHEGCRGEERRRSAVRSGRRGGELDAALRARAARTKFSAGRAAHPAAELGGRPAEKRCGEAPPRIGPASDLEARLPFHTGAPAISFLLGLGSARERQGV